MKIEAHTLRYGNAAWLGLCVPSLEKWCGRNGYDLNVWDGMKDGYPHPKFCEIDMLRDFVAGSADRFLYVDADVLVHPDAPPFDVTGDGFHAATDQYHATHAEDWRGWCGTVFGEIPPEGTVYHNAAVWTCDREAAQRFLVQAQPPFHEALMDEYQWNWWLWNARREGMKFSLLPDKWNHSPKQPEIPDGTWFFHVWGTTKEEEITALKERLMAA